MNRAMKRTTVLTMLLAVSLAACRDRETEMKRGQQQYDVVEEGSAAGVTSTINPLNEQQPVATAPMTNTAADTTTNFTLPNTLPPMTTTDGSIAGTLPTPVYEPTPRPATPRPRTPEPAPAPAPMASSSQPPQQQQTREPENTDTSTPPPATNTATATQTDTAATNVEGEQKSEEKKNETPPPPPPTDTRGNQ